ncbi:MAG: hypothetical protein JNK15_14425 [Planctomycetes bacterium]|nr:hypothetical protein [Planctomycetota bacterium]
MRTPSHLLVSGLALVLGTGLAAQHCRYYPADSPATGAADPRPLGNGNPADPTYGTMRYQMQIPAAVLGPNPLDIVELFVAPAGAATRTFSEIQVRMGHNPNPLTTTMATNFVGFTARPVQHNVLEFATLADQWQPLGMAFPFTYNPANGMLVLEFFVRDAGATGGPANAGLRTDPSIPFVWTSGSGYGGTAVAGGGIKLRFCTDHYGFVEYSVGGCPGSNAQEPRLSYAGSPQVGNTVQIQLSNVPASPTLAVLVYGLTPRVGPVDLGFLGSPGCASRTLADVTTTHVVSGGAASVALPLPPGLPAGFPLWNQWFVIDLPANAFGLTSSDYSRFMIGYQN